MRARAGLAAVAGILIIAAFLGACSSKEQVDQAAAQVPRFRQQMNAQAFEQIYVEAADDLKKVATQKDLVALLSAVDRKLGHVKQSERSGWHINFNTSGTFVTLQFKTEFERGSGNETFVYRISNGQTLLAGYHINSNALIIN